MEKRALFRSGWLPWLLIAPQMAVILVFFFWPASQAIVQSMQAEDAFGTSTSFVGLDNFVTLFEDPAYIESFKVTAIFSALVAVCGIALSLVLAIFADRVVRGALVYKVWHDGFKALDLGGSAAQSVVLMAIVIGLTVIQFRYVEKKVQY